MMETWKQPIHWPVGGGAVRNPVVSKPQKRIVITGPELWRRLHCYRWTSFTDFRDWFNLFLIDVDKLPGCSCGRNFKTKILPQFAGRFCKIATDEEWFTLTVEIHNAVNVELSKQLISLSDALALWSAIRTNGAEQSAQP